MAGSRGAAAQALDVITIGRSSVDLYGQQIGSRLEDIASFAKSVGGCPSNIAIGTARLGLSSALITRVGDEQMGRFIKEQMAREGVALDGIVDRPRAPDLARASLGRERQDLPAHLLSRQLRRHGARRGRHRRRLHRLGARRARHRHAFRQAQHRCRPAQGDARSRAGRRQGHPRHRLPAQSLGPCRPCRRRRALHQVGHASPSICRRSCPIATSSSAPRKRSMIAGGSERHARGAARPSARSHRRPSCSSAGRWAASSIPARSPARIEDGIVGKGFPIEVYNVLGAGDAFMSGFLRGWLRGESLRDRRDLGQCLRRLRRVAAALLAGKPDLGGAAIFPEAWQPAPGAAQGRGDQSHPLGDDAAPAPITSLFALAIDHRRQFEEMADQAGAAARPDRRFKRLAVEATAPVANGRPGFGMLLDETYGREAMFDAAKHAFWIGRPIEEPGSRPLRFEIHARMSARGSSNGRSTIRSSASPSIIPTMTPELKHEQPREAARPVRRGRARSAANC